MNLETQSFNLSSVKNDLKHPSTPINPYELVYLFERCKKNGSLTDVIQQISKSQDRIWGYKKKNSPQPMADRPRARGGAGGSRGPFYDLPAWSQYEMIVSPTIGTDERPDPRWLGDDDDGENLRIRYGLQPKYRSGEMIREWLDKRQGTPETLTNEPLLLPFHRVYPPGFILNTPEYPVESTLVDLLRTYRSAYVFRKKICVITLSSQVESLIQALNRENIPVKVMSRNREDEGHGRYPVLLTTHPRYLGNLKVDYLINYEMYRSVNQFRERHRLLVHGGHMTTFFDKNIDSQFCFDLVVEFKNKKIIAPAFLKEKVDLPEEYYQDEDWFDWF